MELPNFKEALEEAKKTECFIAKIMQRSGYKTTQSNDNSCDIIAERNGIIKRIEIKEQKKTKTTERWAVECECRGKPSGIEVTKADILIEVVHFKDGTIRVFQTETGVIKDLIKDEKYLFKTDGGDNGSHTKMYIFSEKLYFDKRYFKELPICMKM